MARVYRSFLMLSMGMGALLISLGGVFVGCGGPPAGTDCKSDADCKNGFYCKDKKCIQKPAAVCKDACQTNDDCKDCADSKTTCGTNGKCSAANAGNCKATCATDGDCKDCTDGKTVCGSDKKCSAPSSGCLNPCTNDADCKGCKDNKTVCKIGVCSATVQCKAGDTCSKKEDCAGCGSQFDCVANVCKDTTATTVCKDPCATDADCKDCADSKTTCGSDKKCTGGVKVKVGEACDDEKRICDTGLMCIIIDDQDNSYCFQDCTQDQNLCKSNTDGRSTCAPFATDENNNPLSVCLKISEKGGSCSLNTKEQSMCKENLQPPLYCSSKNICEQQVIVENEGEDCNKENDNTDPWKICNVDKALVCDQTTGKCKKAKVAKEFEKCDASGKTLPEATVCEPGHLCVQYDQDGKINVCNKKCDPKKSGECSHNPDTSCYEAFDDGSGICIDTTCATNADCKPAGYVCEDDGSGQKICTPPN